MVQIAHIVNPVKAPPESDLVLAQPITFESMRRAREHARKSVDVSLLTTGFSEDTKDAPPDFQTTPNLSRSVVDLRRFETGRRLPLLRDILDRLFQATTADWLIYSNVDIAVLPHFYVTVADLISQGLDAFVINRRSISAHYTDVSQLHLMYAEVGTPHPGHDCFVFHRSAYPKFVLGNVCIGIDWVGRVLLWNLCLQSKSFREFTDLHLTFHVGNAKVWKNPKSADYRIFNAQEAKFAWAQLASQFGPFAPQSAIGPYLPATFSMSFLSTCA